MEVGKGYKQTDVGVIPEDWDVSPLGKQLRKIPSYGINAPAIPFDFRFPTYLRITDIDEDGRFTESTKASVNHSMSSSYLIEHGDLVFARTGASVGKSYLYNPKDGQLVYAGFLIRVSPDPKRLVPAFLKYYVQSKTYWNWIKTNSMRSGQPGINGREYASLPIPLPPTLAEQEAIAEALSDADALIESLETLLAKKRQVKQGAMSELLTGKRRLPGFGKNKYKQTEIGVVPEDWRVENIGQISIVGRGRVISHKEIAKSRAPLYPVYSSQTYDNGVMGYIDTFDFDGEYVTWTTDGANAGTVFHRNGKFNCTNVCGTIKLKSDNHLFVANVLGRFASKYVSRHLGNPKIMNDVMKHVNIPLPSTIAEQTAIAEILSDMDAEIRAVEEKLSKARGVKAGMMSELLTGKIRLV